MMDGKNKIVGRKIFGKSPNSELMKELNQIAKASFDRQEYLASVLIYFQMVEGLLRHQISYFAFVNRVDEKAILKASEDEQSFPRLVLYLDLVKPDNGLSKRLKDFGKKRNKIVHNLLTFDLNSMKQDLRDFSIEGVRLYRNLLHLDVNKKG
jgi:hypothetical protein